MSDLIRVAVESLASRLDSASGRCFLAIQRHRLVELAGAAERRSPAVRMIAAELESLVGERFDPDDFEERGRLITQMVINRMADRSREEALGTDRLAAFPMAIGIATSASPATGSPPLY